MRSPAPADAGAAKKVRGRRREATAAPATGERNTTKRPSGGTRPESAPPWALHRTLCRVCGSAATPLRHGIRGHHHWGGYSAETPPTGGPATGGAWRWAPPGHPYPRRGAPSPAGHPSGAPGPPAVEAGSPPPPSG